MSFQTSDVEIPAWGRLGGRVFGRQCGHEGETLVDKISNLIRETPREFLPLSTRQGHSERMADYMEMGPRPIPDRPVL